jgi:hypothetical protein
MRGLGCCRIVPRNVVDTDVPRYLRLSDAQFLVATAGKPQVLSGSTDISRLSMPSQVIVAKQMRMI